MEPSQCRAGRALLGMSQDDLARASEVAKGTIAAFETGERKPYRRTLGAIQTALESAGVVFLDPNGNGPGVALSRPVPEPSDRT